MKLIKKLSLLLIVALVVIVGYVLYTTFSAESRQMQVEAANRPLLVRDVLKNFSEGIQLQTVSPEDLKDFDSIQFVKFNDFLSRTYPMSDSLLEHEIINDFSHLYFWEGSDTSLEPVILMGHLDVVPVIDENRRYWKQDPFAGAVVNDTLWGRGTMDDKVGVLGILESVEALLLKGHQPKRSMYLAFGHDEEIGGINGAKAIAAHLDSLGVQAAFILDEGGIISSGMVPGIEKDVALIGVAEKGSVSIQLSIEIEGGHSSMPGKETAIDVLSEAIHKLKANPFPAYISPPIEGFLEYLGPEMSFVNRMAFANAGLFEKMIVSVYEGSASGNALVRTTTSPTIFNSGVKDNIIPLTAKATVNFRIITGSSIAEVKERIRSVIDDDRIKIDEGNFNTEPSKVSSYKAPGFTMLHKTIAEVYPEALVSPYMVVAATDARHYGQLSDQIYRFLPTRINKSNVKSIHGLNERIAVADYETAVYFYTQLIKNATAE
ncbi:M20 family peptidase [Lutimonas sp.]|uniref:M20 family peptidase n=1 Tax=Lutimonas sp. TaxID=1872403 RepID=UPI003D9ABEAE